MLIPPYTKYTRLYVYHLDVTSEPEVDDPDFIGAWQEGETVVLFFHREKEVLVSQICERYGCSVVYQADLDYRDWEAGIEIASFTIGDLTVAPVWDTTPAQIKLDPSVIFGSGFHPTTQLCLQSLLKLLDNLQPPVRRAYDLGCGTGLLSLAAAVKGVNNITAIDYNGLACQVTQANIDLNQFQDHIQVRRLDLNLDGPSTEGLDLVMANLHHELLIELFKRPSFWQARYYIFSGFFVSREEDLLAALPTKKIRFVERHSQNKWGIWVLKGRDNQTSSIIF